MSTVVNRTVDQPERVRYARTSEPDVWLEAAREGFVAAIVDALQDGMDRVVWAWPERADNGFVTAAVALREARTSRERATVALWPWRSAATHAARSILVRTKDLVASARGRLSVDMGRSARRNDSGLQLAAASLCMIELRMNDLLRASARHGRGDRTEPGADAAIHPTLLETTCVFPPIHTAAAATPYEADADQILRRVRRHTSIETIPDHVARIADPVWTPFAMMGLPPDTRDIDRCLASERFAQHGIDVVVVDLTRATRAAIGADWRSALLSLVASLDAANLARRPPVVALCDEGYVVHDARVALGRSGSNVLGGGHRVRKCGAIVLRSGIFTPEDAPAMPALLPLACDADVKDASLRALREKVLALTRCLRDGGRSTSAVAVGSILRVVSAFASLPLGLLEARTTASVLFEGDGREDVKARGLFFPTTRLQRLADAATAAPEFTSEIHALRDEITSHIAQWDVATPVSLKLRNILADRTWNVPEVLLVLPDARTMDVYLVSDAGVACDCTVTDRTTFAEQAEGGWRRIIVVRPDTKAIRSLLMLQNVPSSVLLLGDGAGMAAVALELEQLASIPEFAPFAQRARALADAVRRGGADETLDSTEAEFQYRPPSAEDFIDLAQATDDYDGPTIRLRLESGARAAYRPAGDVLVFTPDSARAFTRVAAQDVRIGDSILVLRKDIRDRLSEALLRSRKTAAQLKVYHERVAAYRRRLSGTTMRSKAREVLAAMQALDPSIDARELPNITRWLSVEPSDVPQQPRAARDRRRFRLFVQAIGLDAGTADIFWDHAILPVRAYSAVEGHAFNRRITQFVTDPEGVAASVGWYEYRDLWHSVVDSVERVTDKEVTHG